MNVAKTKVFAVLSVLSLLCIGLFFWVMNGDQQGRSGKAQQAKLTIIGDNNQAALRSWAKASCRGWTLNDLAVELGVNPTIKGIATSLGKGLSKRSRQIIEEACEYELIKTAKTRSSQTLNAQDGNR